MRMALRIFITAAFGAALVFPASVATAEEQVAHIRLSEKTVERGYTAPFFDGAIRIGVQPHSFAGGATLEVKKKMSAHSARTEVPPPILQEFASDVYEYSLIGVRPNALKKYVHLSFDGASVPGAAVYFYDRNALSWRKLQGQSLTDSAARAASPFVYGLLAVLKPIADADAGDAVTRVRSALVVNGTDTPLYAKNVSERLPIASLTKLMTALVFLDHNPGWQSAVTIQRSDAAVPANLPVAPGDRIMVKDLFYAMIVGSRNNAAKALARSTGLPRDLFITKMNERARGLGMAQTRFVDETGLDPRNQSTAEDIAKLAQAAFAHPDVARAAQTKRYVAHPVGSSRTLSFGTTNKLLESDLAVIGGKTGYNHEAGYTFAMQVDEGERRMIIILLGSPSSEIRFAAAELLARRASQAYARLSVSRQ